MKCKNGKQRWFDSLDHMRISLGTTFEKACVKVTSLFDWNVSCKDAPKIVVNINLLGMRLFRLLHSSTDEPLTKTVIILVVSYTYPGS